MNAKPISCEPCPLYKVGKGFVALGSLVNPLVIDGIQLLIQGEAPGENEIEQGRAFVGTAGYTLRHHILGNAGIDEHTVVYDNTLRCLPPRSKKGDWYPQGDIRKQAESCCRQYDKWSLYPKHIPLLVVGGKAGNIYRGSEKISEYHGHIEFIEGRTVGYTFHPSAVNRQFNLLPVAIRETMNLMRANRNPQLLTRPNVYKGTIPYIPNEACVFDLEWNEKQIPTVIGVAYDGTNAYSTFDTGQIEVVQNHMDIGTCVVGHNIIDADLPKMGRLPKSWHPKHVFDTFIVSHLVHAHLSNLGLLDLGSLVRFYEPTQEWKSDKSDLLLYNGYDCAYNYRLYEALKEDLTLTNQWHLVERQQELARLAYEMRIEGVDIDIDALKLAVVNKKSEKEKLAAEFPFNPNAPKQIVEWVSNNLSIHIENAQYETLEHLRGRDKLLDKLIEYREDVKSIKTWFPYEEDKKGNLTFATSTVHPSFNVTGTDVGRFSCSEPNFQNLPPNLRHIICAPPGFEIVSFDGSQIENRCVAWLARDQAMLDDFASGLDIHSLVASRIFNKRLEDVTAEDRFNGKITVHASNYGETEFNLAMRLYGNRNRESVNKARALQAAYFKPYYRTRQWQQEVSARLETGNVMLRNPYDRVRFVYAHNPHERKKRGCHYLGCSTAADSVSVRALWVWKEEKIKPRLIVHDELVYFLPKGDLESRKRINTVLHRPCEELNGYILPWGCKVGQNYGNMVKVKV